MREFALIGGALRHKWWVVLLVTVIVAGLFGAWGAVRQEQYSSTARLTVTILGEGKAASSFYQSNLAAESRVRTYAELAESGVLLNRVSAQTGLRTEDLREMVTASPVSTTVLFDVTATADSAEDAQTVAQVVADTYPEVIRSIETPDVDVDEVSGGTVDEDGRPVPSTTTTGPAAFATVVSDADKPTGPNPPTKPQTIVIGALAGLLLGLVLGVAADLLDRRLRRPEDLEAAVPHVPVIGEIPAVKNTDGKRALVDFRGGSSAAAEALRRVRTSLRFIGGARTPVYLITSSVPHEGKTFLSASLGRAFTEAGDRTLVIGADLRSPALGPMFGVPGDIGLSNYLAAQVDVDDVIFPGIEGDPDILPAGPVPPNPSELLGNGRLKALLQWARENYDIVIIDTPPVAAVTDAVIAAPEADATILVSRMNMTSRTAVTDTIENLRRANIVPSGVVASFVRGAGGSYGKYGYGYGYGYGETAEMNRKLKMGRRGNADARSKAIESVTGPGDS